MYRVNLTEDQARQLHDARSIADGFSILLEAAGTDLLLRYLAQQKPRPQLHVTRPASFIQPPSVPMIGCKIDPVEPPRRIELGIDGDHAFALLGDDIQSGESEFVPHMGIGWRDEIRAANHALYKLRTRLGKPDHPYFFGNSHPYGNG